MLKTVGNTVKEINILKKEKSYEIQHTGVYIGHLLAIPWLRRTPNSNQTGRAGYLSCRGRT